MTAPRNDPRAEMENELLSRLGLTRDANTQDIEAAHDDVVAFLESAPEGLHDWAKHEIASADEAYALLFDPTAAIPAGAVLVATAPAVAPEIAEAPTPASAAATPNAAPAAVTDDEEEEILADEPVPTRPIRDKSGAATAPADTASRNRLLTRLALVGAGLVGVAVLVVAVYSFGGGGAGVPGFNGTPAPESSAAAGAGVDQTQVAQLMKQLQADPNDVTVMQELADIYYTGNDFATAGTFFDKILAIDPKNVNALLGRGATAYNVGNQASAEKDWRAVLAVEPDNLDAHYYLGFMYLDAASPDLDKVKAEWNRVVEIAPDSDLAKTVKQHLDSLSSFKPETSGAPAPSAAPGATAAPAASPATPAGGVQPPSASPSGTIVP